MSDAGAEQPLLIAEGLSKYYGRQLGCRDASLALYEGEVMVVVGESGSGKSTLLQLLSGQIEPSAGRVLYRMRDGTTAASLPAAAVTMLRVYCSWPGASAMMNLRCFVAK